MIDIPFHRRALDWFTARRQLRKKTVATIGRTALPDARPYASSPELFSGETLGTFRRVAERPFMRTMAATTPKAYSALATLI